MARKTHPVGPVAPFSQSDSPTGRAARTEEASERTERGSDQVWEGATKFKNNAPPGEGAYARKQRLRRQG